MGEPVAREAGLRATTPVTGGGPHRSPTRTARVSLGRAVQWSRGNGLLFAFIILVVVFTVASDRFLTQGNLTVILLNVSVIGLIAVPGAMLVLAGFVDLSVGSVSTLASIVFGAVAAGSHLNALLASLVAVGAGLGWGLLNGILICYLEYSAIVVTLGGLAGASGVAEIISNGQTQTGFGDTFDALGNRNFAGLPIPVWIFFGVFLIGAYVWYAMRYGRHFTAIGADQAAARSLGIKFRRQVCVLYAASGMAAALGGLIVTGQLDAASLTIGQGQELQVLTAILLGGVSFVGGRGSLLGVLIGVLFIGVLHDGLVLVNINAYVNDVAVGAALVFAAALDRLYRGLDRVAVNLEDPERATEVASPDAPTVEPSAKVPAP